MSNYSWLLNHDASAYLDERAFDLVEDENTNADANVPCDRDILLYSIACSLSRISDALSPIKRNIRDGDAEYHAYPLSRIGYVLEEMLQGRRL